MFLWTPRAIASLERQYKVMNCEHLGHLMTNGATCVRCGVNPDALKAPYPRDWRRMLVADSPRWDNQLMGIVRHGRQRQ